MLGFKVVRNALFAMLQNGSVLFRILAFWLPVMIAASLLQVLATVNLSSQFALNGEPIAPSQLLPFIFAFASGLVSMIGAIVVAIAWHRFILLREEPDGIVIWPSNWKRLSYFFALMVLGIIVGVFFMILSPLFLSSSSSFMASGEEANIGDRAYVLTILFGLLLSLLYFIPLFLLGMILPKIAIGEPWDLGEYFGAAMRNFLSVLVLAIVSVVVFMVPTYGLELMFGSELTMTSQKEWPHIILSTLCYTLGVVFEAGLLSLWYAELRRSELPTNPSGGTRL